MPWRLLRRVARDREPKSKLGERVAQLERDLGVRLIEHSTRSIQVTGIGRDVFAQCKVIAGGLDDSALRSLGEGSREDRRQPRVGHDRCRDVEKKES